MKKVRRHSGGADPCCKGVPKQQAGNQRREIGQLALPVGPQKPIDHATDWALLFQLHAGILCGRLGIRGGFEGTNFALQTGDDLGLLLDDQHPGPLPLPFKVAL